MEAQSIIERSDARSGTEGEDLAELRAHFHGMWAEVVLSEVAVEMTSIAAARAAALGLDNVRTREAVMFGISGKYARAPGARA